MGGGQTQTQNSTQVQNTTPWSPAIPALQQGLTDATSLYNSGVGSQIYQGQRNAAFSTDQSAGIQSVRDQAAADNSGALGTSYLQNLFGSNGVSPLTSQGLGLLSGVSGINAGAINPRSVLGISGLDGNGLTGGQNAGLAALFGVQNTAGQLGLDQNGLSQGTGAALGQLNSVRGVDTGQLQGLANRIGDPNSAINQTAGAFMNGSRDITTQPALNDLYNRALAPSSAEQNLSGVAAGANLDPTQNAIFQRLAQTSADNAAQAQKEAFAASGRYGSGAFSGAVAKAVNDTQSQLYASQYNQERANQASAAGQIDSARQAGTQLGSGIQSQIGQVQQQNNQNRLSGAGLAQAQNAAQAGVLGQVLGGDEFNSNLDLTKAQGTLGAMQQGTQNNINTRQFDANLGLQQAQAALGTYGQGAAARLQGATTDVGNDLTAQSQNIANSLAAQQYNAGLGLQQAQGYIGAGQQGLSSALQGAGLLPSVDALRYAPANNLLQVGGLQQQQSQADLNALQSYFQDTQSVPWQALSQYMAFPSSIGSMGGTSVTQGTSQTKTSGPGILQSLLGGISSIAGIAGKLSDERAKENIQPVGELHDGQTVYRYNYKGEEAPQIGLLAQEVQKVEPDAVGKVVGGSGLLGVDYGKATDKAAAMAPGLLGGDVPAQGAMTVMIAAKPKGKKGDKGGSGTPAAPAMPKAMAEAVGQAVTGLLAHAGKRAA
jgi:hypothetical protein